jgi:chitodextrinase
MYGIKMQTKTYASDLLTNFITRSGDKLMDGSNQFRWISVNCLKALGPMGLNYNFGDSSDTLPTDAELYDLVMTVKQMGGKVMRTYIISAGDAPLTHVFINTDNTVILNETSFERIDKLLQICNEQCIRLVIPLCNDYPWCGGKEQYEAKNGRGFYTINSVANQRLKNMISQLVNRTNTCTGVKYKDDKAILCWATGNELHGSDAWVSDLCGYIKSVDPNHLVMDGREIYNQIYPTYGCLDDPNVDIVGTSLYYTDGTSANTVSLLRNETKGHIPLVITEVSMNLPPDSLNSVFDEVINDGTTAAMYWAVEGHSRNGGFYFNQSYQDLHWPGFASVTSINPDIAVEQQKLDSIANHAYEISGLSRPALPIPEAPQLNPIIDVGHISWMGSVGAQTYDIERATSPDGPWTVVKSDFVDVVICYHPLFSDEPAVVGQSYYYGVKAKNTSGISSPSNVVGPVSINSVWLVDNMFDYLRMYSHDSNIIIHNSYCSGPTLGEDIAVLKRDDISGGSIVYKINGNIKSFNVYAYFDNTTYADNTFYVSPEGVNYTQITPTINTYTCLGDGYRYAYQSVVSAGYQYLKITFNENSTMDWPALGRAEIEYTPGAKNTEADATPPKVPKGLTVSSVSIGSIVLKWEASTDNNKVMSYSVYRNHNGDKKHIANTSSLVYVDTSVLYNQTYTYTVAAYDQSLNISVESSSVTATVPAPIPTQVLVVDNFESYTSTSDLQSGWKNAGSNPATANLDTTNQVEGNNCLRFDFTAAGHGNSGLNHKISQNWSGYKGISFWVKFKEVNNYKLCIQFVATGQCWEYSFMNTSTDWTKIYMPFYKFAPPRWAGLTKNDLTLDLSNISKFNVFENTLDGGADATGSIYIDDIKVLIDNIIDDFESYNSDSGL